MKGDMLIQTRHLSPQPRQLLQLLQRRLNLIRSLISTTHHTTPSPGVEVG